MVSPEPYWSGFPPLEDILEWRSNPNRPRRFDESEGPGFREFARPCPECGSSRDDLEWFWFESPEPTWQMLCGRAGWVSFCARDERPVQFFLALMN